MKILSVNRRCGATSVSPVAHPKRLRPFLSGFLVLAILASLLPHAQAADYIWRTPQAKVLVNGDLVWDPDPFSAFDPASYAGEVRFIDFTGGNDSADGKTPATAWKHHPWDWRNVEGNASQHSGPTAYIFKRGVSYRGALRADESGTGETPIILTSSADWGEGEAIFLGSEPLPAQWVPAGEVTYPENLPEVDKVWALDLAEAGFRPVNEWYDYAGADPEGPSVRYVRSLELPYIGMWRVDSSTGEVTALHVARTPDWQRGDDNFVLDYWHAFDGQKERKDPETGKSANLAYDDFLVGKQAEDLAGGYIWTQYPSFMGTPTPSRINAEASHRGMKGPFIDPADGTILKGAMGGLGANVRYMMEHLPQFLDAAGEIYLDEDTFTLFYRPEDGANPNREHLELAVRMGALAMSNQSNIEVSGLNFRFIEGAAVDFSQQKNERAENINIHHCSFKDIMRFGITAGQNGRKGGNHMDRIRVADNQFENIWETAITVFQGRSASCVFNSLELLRNKTYNTGMRHRAVAQASIPAISVGSPKVGVVAGNIVERTFGQGIEIWGGNRKGNVNTPDAWDIPLTRITAFHNRIEDAALGLNDYGALEVWQSGVVYTYNNLSGNSVGHMPGGWGGRAKADQVRKMNPSYPLYLDGDYKQYSFNNILWTRPEDSGDPYGGGTAYFMVFGFMNEFFNNTLYNASNAMGGSPAGRQNTQGNLSVDITHRFFHQGHGSFSQAGGGDDGSVSGIETLAYANNLFHGTAEAGSVALERKGAIEDIAAKTIEELQVQMAHYGLNDEGIRISQLGKKAEVLPIRARARGAVDDLATSGVDFRPALGSQAIDAGGIVFVPWALYGTVGEWHFNRNDHDPATVLDYHWYYSNAHVERRMYQFIPNYPLLVNEATESDYVPSQSEDWVEGALVFDGTSRYAAVSQEQIQADAIIPIKSFTKDWADRSKSVIQAMQSDECLWTVDEPSDGYDEKGRPRYSDGDYARFSSEKLKTPEITSQNVLVEIIIRVAAERTDDAIIGKHDGTAGYRLYIDADGKACFEISSDGISDRVVSAMPVNDGQWHHIIAEADRREDGSTLNLHIDGKLNATAPGVIGSSLSLGNDADLLVAARRQDGALVDYLAGAMDYARICRGTLADSQTSIEELYAWQTDGPARYDYKFRAPVGRRDIGAIEALPAGQTDEPVSRTTSQDTARP